MPHRSQPPPPPPPPEPAVPDHSDTPSLGGPDDPIAAQFREDSEKALEHACDLSQELGELEYTPENEGRIQDLEDAVVAQESAYTLAQHMLAKHLDD
jgi:hypothetical protein